MLSLFKASASLNPVSDPPNWTFENGDRHKHLLQTTRQSQTGIFRSVLRLQSYQAADRWYFHVVQRSIELTQNNQQTVDV